jgi:ABC-2 type transport system permease protein
LGFIVYQITLAVAALGLARERELGTLEQLMVTPLRRIELTLGKGIPAVIIGGGNFALMYAISLGLFRIPMNGSPLLLAALTLVFITAVVGLGVTISAVSRSQQQAILFVFIQALVDMTFSGFLVPVKNMPAALQTVSRFVPLQYYLAVVRSIMLKGATLDVLWPQALALVALSLAMGLVALRSVAWQVE